MIYTIDEFYATASDQLGSEATAEDVDAYNAWLDENEQKIVDMTCMYDSVHEARNIVCDYAMRHAEEWACKPPQYYAVIRGRDGEFVWGVGTSYDDAVNASAADNPQLKALLKYLGSGAFQCVQCTERLYNRVREQDGNVMYHTEDDGRIDLDEEP